MKIGSEDPNGILLLDKPAGLSSAACLNRLKQRLGISKLGHAGTLDPFATGLLVCVVGRATRLASFAQHGEKRYRGIIRFGLSTSTDDITGAIVAERAVKLEPSALGAAVERMRGPFDQIPPQISAVKVEGKRAYRRVRDGEELKLAPRRVVVRSFEYESLDSTRVSFLISCSGGTYIRAIARDLGQALGCGACLESLRREGSAPFDVGDAREIDAVSWDDLLPWDRLVVELPRIWLGGAELERVMQGSVAQLDACAPRFDLVASGRDRLVYGDEEQRTAVGVVERREGSWRIMLTVANQHRA